MEISREGYRWIIYHNFRRGLSQQECVDELNSLYGDKTPTKTTQYIAGIVNLIVVVAFGCRRKS